MPAPSPPPTYVTVRLADPEKLPTAAAMYLTWLPLATAGATYAILNYWDVNGNSPYTSTLVHSFNGPQTYGANWWAEGGGTLGAHRHGMSFGAGLANTADNTTATGVNYAVWVGDGSVVYPTTPAFAFQFPAPGLGSFHTGSYVVYWPEQTGVVGYKIYRKQVQPNIGHCIAVVLSTPTNAFASYSDPDTSNRDRDYFVTAFDSNYRESRETYASAGVITQIAATGTFLFGGHPSLSTTGAGQAITLAFLGTTGTLLFGGLAGTPDLLVERVPCKPVFSFGCQSNVFAVSGGATCAGAVYNDGRQQGCNCVVPPPTPVPTTPFLSSTGGFAFGGAAGLTTSVQTLEDFLPPAHRTIFLIDAKTVKGSMIGGDGTDLKNSPSAQMSYLGPAADGGNVENYQAVSGNRPYVGASRTDWPYGEIVANSDRFWSATYTVNAVMDPAFTAGNSGYTLLMVGLVQYMDSSGAPPTAISVSDGGNNYRDLVIFPSGYTYANSLKSQLIFGKNLVGGEVLSWFPGEDTRAVGPAWDSTYRGVDGIPNYTANSVWGPSAWAVGCVVGPGSFTATQHYTLWMTDTQDTAAGASTFHTGALTVASATHTTALSGPVAIYFGQQTDGSSRLYGHDSLCRNAIWMLAEGMWTTAQTQAFLMAVFQGIRMKGSAP